MPEQGDDLAAALAGPLDDGVELGLVDELGRAARR